MTSETKTPRVPAVGDFIRLTGKLLKVETFQPPPPPPRDEYVFEDLEASTLVFINGKAVKILTTFNDFYGRGTCVIGAIDSARSELVALGLTEGVEGPVELLVRLTRSYRRFIPSRSRGASLYAPEFVDMDPVTHAFGQVRPPLPESVTSVVWSSIRGRLDGLAPEAPAS